MAAKTNFEIIKEIAVEEKTCFVSRQCPLGGCGVIHGTTENYVVETPEVLREFLATNPEISPSEFVMSLKWAIENKYPQILRELYLYRPVFTYPKNIRETLLHFAIKTNIKTWVIRDLYSDLRDDPRWKFVDPRWKFVMVPRTLEIIEIVASHEPNINRKDFKGRTPFFLVCRMGNLPVATLLHQLGADVNIPDNNGTSALNSAIRSSKIELIRTLMAYGVIPTETDVFDAFWRQNKREAFDSVFNPEIHSSAVSRIRNKVDNWRPVNNDPEFINQRFAEWIT